MPAYINLQVGSWHWHSKSLELTSIVVARDQSPTNQSRKAVTMSDDRSWLFLKLLGEVKHYVYSMCFSSRVGIRVLLFLVFVCVSVFAVVTLRLSLRLHMHPVLTY